MTVKFSRLLVPVAVRSRLKGGRREEQCWHQMDGGELGQVT